MTYDALHYFVSLLIISVLLLPLYNSVASSNLRQSILIGTGLWMLYTISPRLLIFYPLYWLIVWGFTRISASITETRSRSSVFGVSILVLLLPMLLWKLYPDWFLVTINNTLEKPLLTLLPILEPIDRIAYVGVPLGLSFATFRALDLAICVHLDIVEKPRLRDVMQFGLFAPVLVIGPIIQFQEVTNNVSLRNDQAQNFIRGVLRVAIGLMKLFFIAIPLAPSLQVLSGFNSSSSASQLELATQCVFFAWYLYINFSAYSDISIGMSRMYGFKIRENFSFPYFKTSPQQFWANWHMSLTSFAQRNIFIPLGGFRASKQYVATFATMMVIALWHGLNTQMIAFGLMHGTVLVALRYKSNHFPSARPATVFRRFAGGVFTFLFVAATIPLLILKAETTIPFYAKLLLGYTP